MINIERAFSGFMKMVDCASKLRAEVFTHSSGVVSTYYDGILSIITMDQKMESDLVYFFKYIFDFEPLLFKFMDKHFTIHDVYLDDDELIFDYTCDLGMDVVVEDRNFVKVMDSIRKLDGKDIYRVTLKVGKSELYDTCVAILNGLDDLDHDRTEIHTVDTYNTVNKDVRPLEIISDPYFIRISKSVFQNIVKDDKPAEVRFIPYKDTSSSVFLTMTTVNKKLFQVINVFNTLYLRKDDEIDG